jgi:hypothetical protein
MSRPTAAEIDEQTVRAMEQTSRGGSKYPGMTYEEGVLAALDWICGFAEEPPMEDDEDDLGG